jgi:hypothetical protein
MIALQVHLVSHLPEANHRGVTEKQQRPVVVNPLHHPVPLLLWLVVDLEEARNAMSLLRRLLLRLVIVSSPVEQLANSSHLTSATRLDFGQKKIGLLLRTL